MLLRPSLVSNFIGLTSAAVGLFAFAPGRIEPLFRRRLTLRSTCQWLDTDVVFLVRTPDFDTKRVSDRLGNFEFGGRFQNTDGADVMLVDAATTANHRQEPARFRFLPPSDGGAKPHAALHHALTRR